MALNRSRWHRYCKERRGWSQEEGTKGPALIRPWHGVMSRPENTWRTGAWSTPCWGRVLSGRWGHKGQWSRSLSGGKVVTSETMQPEMKILSLIVKPMFKYVWYFYLMILLDIMCWFIRSSQKLKKNYILDSFQQFYGAPYKSWSWSKILIYSDWTIHSTLNNSVFWMEQMLHDVCKIKI